MARWPGVVSAKARQWSDEEVMVLTAWYRAYGKCDETLRLDELARQLGRDKSLVCRKARQLGLTKQNRGDQLQPSLIAGRRTGSCNGLRIRAKKPPHPRGMKGKKHTPEARQRMGEASRQYYDTVDPESERDRVARSMATRLERHGTAGPVTPNNYSRGKGGLREDLGIYVRSRWEANYARYLNWLQAKGEIREWSYEPETFVFHGETRGPISYTPDFRVVDNVGAVAFHEVKGWMDPKSQSKLNKMDRFYPEVRIILIAKTQYRAIWEWRRLIPGWESEVA